MPCVMFAVCVLRCLCIAHAHMVFCSRCTNKVLAGFAGFAVAFFDTLAANTSPEQQNAFCSSMLDAWEAAQYYKEPTGWLTSLNTRWGKKGPAPPVLRDAASTLCLCLAAFGPDRLQQVQPPLVRPAQQCEHV